MSDNVIMLGAGFSHDAGIPLMSGFVERMWEYAIKQKNGNEQLSLEDIEIFQSAIRVRNELDGYHGRATFNDRNIEDILSILSFNVLGGGQKEREKLTTINRAIARTIELSCAIKHPGVKPPGKNTSINDGPALYRDLWLELISWYEKTKSFPTIITFNYDLVLERSLLQIMINRQYYSSSKPIPFAHFSLEYHYNKIPKQSFEVKYTKFNLPEFQQAPGTTLERVPSTNLSDNLDIEILKLHGSLNFPSMRKNITEDSYNLCESLDNPNILPPITNKILSNTASDIWRIALKRLRGAKNIIIVGYSFPKTDIYMQYFLKAALGPNVDLNRIFVFDPVLYQNTNANSEMRSRFKESFSAQLQSRIIFNHPEANSSSGYNTLGTTNHFVDLLKHKPEYLLF